MRKFFGSLLIIPVFLSGLLAQEPISLYLEPDADGTIYFRESLEALNARGPQPFPADQEVTEWMRVDYPGTYVGYVAPALVNEDMTVQEGAEILLRPQDGSQVLAVVDTELSPQVIELGPNWATVYYEGEAPAYFKWPSERSVAPVTEMITVTSASPAEGGEIVAVTEVDEIVVVPSVAVAPAASSEAASTSNTPQQSTPVRRSPVPQSMMVSQPQTSAPASVSQTPELAPIAATQRPTIATTAPPPPMTSKQVTRLWEGKLVRIKGLEKVFGRDYEYALENAAGDRIAYVDLSQAILFQPVMNYWGENVFIDGVAENIVSTTPVVIKAKSLRPKLQPGF